MTNRLVARVSQLAKITLAALGVGLFSAPAFAASQTPTYFTAVFSSENAGEEQVARKRDSLATVTLRPQIVAVLDDGVDPELLDDLDIPDDALGAPGSLVFGSINRRSLFCSTLQVSISSKANACFRDFNGNGDFEQIVRSSVDQLDSDFIVPDDEGTISGVRFDRRRSLSAPLRYRVLEDAEAPTFTARLGWIVSSRRDAKRGEPVFVGFKLYHDDTSSSNWEAVSECYLTVRFAGEPLSVRYHDNVIHILGFTEKGDLRYRIEPASAPQQVGFVYQRIAGGTYGGIIFQRQHVGLDAC